ncbi:GNAT family protein [Streptomyces sp. TG1A-8]|uniref:GNAT family N-acetyltransferase n=1 Tax=Streptomyces sp. TG1A-8 TaxID=3051385 RepID=UPI00265BBB2D|nr:GNAT family protein [Streptomyces sp. TG1A-8]MDO0930044.1 GNAT family protein [Streptomyces sp. TG1A-8]
MTHPLPAHLTGTGLALRPFSPEDEPLLTQALGDAEILRWATGAHLHRLPADERAAQWLRTRLAAWSDGVPDFAIADPGTGELTGYIGLRRIHNGNAEVGSWIAPWARGRGLAADALLTAAGWALAPTTRGGLGLHRIALHHSTGNPASCTVATKAGLLLEGTMRQATTDHTGTRYDSHLHARLASDPDPRERVPTPS